MKSAKKLMLLLLSLVLLIGTFAVVALAENDADVATVVYPDGTTETYAVGEAIVPKAFTDGFYEGKGNTLWQGDAWSFTVSGEATALADLTVTDAMVGKTIMASGAQQVYSKINIHLPEGDYYEYITGSSYKIDGTEYRNPIYVLSGTSGTATHKVLVNGAEVEETVEYSTTKRVAGDYTVYFYDAESFAKFFSTACSLELGGVTVDHKDLRTLSDTKITATLYADHTIGNTFNWGKGYDRATNKNMSNSIAQGEGGNAKVYFDLNGHTVVNNSTSTMELTEMSLIMYSSKPGAHFYKEASSTAFYVSDGGTLFVGNNDSNTDTYSDNLYVHAKALFNTMYGNGAYVIGGHYYQTAGATSALFDFARRLNAIQNASFYAQNGNAVLDDDPSDGGSFANGSKAIKNCSFYSFGTSPLANLAKGATPKFENCSFYNVTGVPADATAGTATAKTVTFADGTTDKFFAASLEEAKAYVEGHPKAKATPGLVEKDGVMYLDVAPQVSVAYDANFNATVTKTDGALKLVYYKVEKTLTGEVEYVCENNLAAYLVAMTHGGAKITMYQDLTTSNLTVKAERVVVTTENKTAAESAVYYLDLNGHKITFTGSGLALDMKAAKFYVYSSVKGGVLDATNHTLFRSNNDDYTSIDGVIYDSDSATYKAKLKEDSKYPIIKPSNYTYVGEADNAGNKVYGDNLTVYCEKINQDMYGQGAYINGGIFVQVGNANPSYFLLMGRTGGNNSHVQAVRNATFVTINAATSPIYLRGSSSRDIQNCTFISTVEAGVPVSAYTDLASGKATFNFKNCNFVNVLPLLGSQYATYDSDTAYGTTSGVFSMADLDITDAEQYLGHGATSKTVTAFGETCVMDGTVITDAAKALKLTREGIGTDFWAIGSVPSEKTNAEDKEIDGETYVPYYDYSAVDAIDAISGAVTKGGEATVAVSYKALVANAFTYQVDGGEIIAVPTLGDPELDGENFVSILNNLYNVKIVMYKDIILKSGVQFATLKDATDPKGKTVKVVDKSGYVDWDLNGCKVTVAAGATPIAMIAERESQGAQTNNVLHYAANASFKLYSSVAGGQYINETAYPIFGINKYAEPRVIGSYLLGTNDPAVNGGDNLTIVSNGPISMAYETQGNGPEGYTLYINGGTYVYNGTMAMFNVAATVKIYNAKMLAAGGALALIVNQFWAPTNLYVENLTAVSAASGTKLIESGNYTQIIANGKAHTVSVKDVAFAGGTLNLSYNNVAFTVAGEIKAPDAAGLALAYPEAPAGKSAAYSSLTVRGVSAKLLAYYENPTTVTVNNTVSGLVENWLVGSTYVADAATQNLIQEEGVWYYIPNPELVGKVDGVLVDDICAPENAGKTVVVEVGGDREKLYFTVSLNGVLSYYYGASAPAALPSKLAPADTQTYLITFYSDIVTDIAGTTTIGGKAATIKVDLNGYTWKHNSTNNYAFVTTAATSFIYSSVPGGVLDVSNAGGIACTDGSGHAYFGEATKDGTEYGKNFTVLCKAIHNGRWWSTNGYIVGGTYIQPEGVTAVAFFAIDDGPTPVVRNSTFIVNSLSSGFVRGVKGTFTNCTFIAKNASNITVSGKSNTGATFNGCYFYNVIPNIPEGTSVTYNDCFFSASSLIAQNGGYIAYTGEPVTKTVNGVDYVFGAKLVASATLVTWGYGLEAEYWVAGATATHADIILDGAFVYAFAPVTVGADPVTATASLKGFVSGMLLTQLEVENQLIFKFLIAADSAIENIVIGGKTIPVSELDKVDGYYVLSDRYSPSKAADTIALTLIGAYNHEIKLSLELYANAVLADESLAASHNLVYAMVEYVELMSGKDLEVNAPAGYETKLPEVVAASDTLGLYFSICHDETLTLGVAGAPDEALAFEYLYSELAYEWMLGAEGMEYFEVPHLVDLALGIKFYGDEKEFSYTLGNYIYALKNAEVVNAEAIAQLYALYNYAAYAADYVAE